VSEVVFFGTPEGWPGLCPVCESVVCVEPPALTGDAPCPHCGHLLWFVNVSPRARFYRSEDVSAGKRVQVQAALEVIYSRLNAGVPAERGGGTPGLELGLDSLDLLELVMQIEADLGVTIPDGAAARFRTLGELVDYLVRELPD
jgi:acyl carrier protein